MSIHNLTIKGSHKRPSASLREIDQTSKRRRLGDSPENSAALQANLRHPHLPSFAQLLSSTKIADNREENLVTVICDLGTYLLENKPDVASAKFVEAELAKVSSTDPRVDTLRKKILEINASNACEAPVPNELPSTQPPQTSPIYKARELLTSGNTLAWQAQGLSGPTRLEKLDEAEAKLEASLKIVPNNASALRSLGRVLRLQAHLLSGPTHSTKLNEAQNKFKAALEIEQTTLRTSLKLVLLLRQTTLLH